MKIFRSDVGFCGVPRMTTFTDSGTFTRTSLVIQELKTSVGADAEGKRIPTAPTMRRMRVRADVHLSRQERKFSAITEWQMPSETFTIFQFAMQA